MDEARALVLLENFRQRCAEAVEFYRRNHLTDWWADPTWIQLDDGLKADLQSTQRVVSAIDPELAVRPDYATYSNPWSDARDAVVQAMGTLRRRAEIDEILGPQGPVLRADGFHSWVWGAAARLWTSGHHREAVAAAFERVQHEARSKIGRYDGPSGRALAMSLWSDAAPKPDEPRLRPVGLPQPSDSYTSALEGAKYFHAGCAQRVRNLSTHGTTRTDEQEALESLAAISVLARWIDAAEVDVG